MDNLDVEHKTLIGNVKYEYQNNSNFDINLIYNYSHLNGILKFLSYFKSQFLLIYLVLIGKPDCIHFQWLKVPILDYIIVIVLKILLPNSRFVFTAHNLLPHDSGNKFKWIFAKIYKLVDHIIVHDHSTKTEMKLLFSVQQEKVFVIPHGLLKINQTEQSPRAKSRNKITFSLIGFLNNYKGVDILINAWLSSNILKNNKTLQLVIAGKASPEIKNKLLQLNGVTNSKVLDKFLSDNEFNDLIEKSDVLIFPYRKISQSGVLLTALAHRKPVLVSRVGGLTQPFEVGKIGWTLNDLSYESLKDSLEYISMNPEEINQIKNDECLWGNIYNYYNWGKISEKTCLVYNL